MTSKVDASERIPVNQPVVSEAAKQRVMQTLASGWLSGAGPVVAEFEQAFAACVGATHGVATGSGTTALHLALCAAGIAAGDEVIVPDFTIFATLAAVMYCGARPVCVDVDPRTFTIDPAAARAAISARTRAIIAVHIYGHSADMNALRELATDHQLILIEDAAQAHGARYRGRPCGGLGDVAAFSFYGNKLISTGEGGMVTTSNPQIAARARSLGDMAHRPGQRFCHDQLGYSYRMSSLQAALGLGQLSGIEALIARKRWIAERYKRGLGSIPGLRLPHAQPGVFNVYWMVAIVVEDGFPLDRDQLRDALARDGIETRDFFQPCSQQPAYRERFGDCAESPVTADIARRGLYLPSGLALTAAQLDRVCAAIERLAGR
ncbi:MAG: DegT/DnrJ/EryC1/StrS family aminotransferase [Xanthomonadales bacterium]|nr:DegT/DnrJ/EryC1/StrS family aminotransferase [Xanthomonadales bacterium]